MPFGEIFTGSFQLIWRHKKLFLFPVIGMALYAIGMFVYQLAGAAWLTRYLDWLNAMMRNPDPLPPDITGQFFGGMATMWIAAAVFFLFALLSFFIGLVTTSGLILEADRARDDGQVDVGRGLREGLGRAGHYFLVQMAWVLPGLLLGCGTLAGIFILAAGAGAASADGRDTAGGALGLIWFLCLCGAGCLSLIYLVAAGFLQPLMIQSAVAGRRSAGQAIREGWRLARANLGGVIIVWLLIMAVSAGVLIVVQVVTTLVSLPLTGVWLAVFGRIMADAQQGVMPQFPRISGPLYLITSLFSLALTLVGTLLLQTFSFVAWNGVYRYLTRPAVAVVEAPEPVGLDRDEASLEHEDAENSGDAER
jgi:hypothetical protein